MKIVDLKSNPYRFSGEMKLLAIDNRLIVLRFLVKDIDKLSR